MKENMDAIVMQYTVVWSLTSVITDSKVHGANMGPIWGRQYLQCITNGDTEVLH